MAAFSIEQTRWGPHDIVILHDAARGRTVRLARHGATLVSLEQMIGAKLHRLSDGYRDSGEIETRPSSRFAIMAPFANRIADARYTFDGQAYDLQPGVQGADRASRHGFVRGVDFDIAHVHADERAARVTFATSVIRPGTFDGYPFAIDLAVTFALDAGGMSLTSRMRNVGDRAAPCFFGWHPYFRISEDGIDSLELEIPASTRVQTNADYIPLPDNAAYQPLDEAPAAFDFRHAKPIGATKIDNGYVHLAMGPDGRAHTRLRDPVSGIGISVWQEKGVMHAFTADTVTRDVRRSIALEPMESMANAFNRADCAEAIRLAPGAEREFHCGVAIHLP